MVASGSQSETGQRQIESSAVSGRLIAALAHVFRPSAAAILLAGAVVVQFLHALPPRWFDFALAALGLILLSGRWWALRAVGLLVLGAGWTLLRADVALSQRLTAGFEGEDFVVIGSVHGLPRVTDEATRFDLSIASATHDGAPFALTGLVRLSWHDTAPLIEPCSNWRLHVRLKRPRGLVDPGAFDFERYALSEGISATGYVRDDDANRDVGARPLCADRFRQRIVQGIADTLGPGAPSDVLRALAFGDQQAMDEHEWQVARATGIPHLIAISGLHIALFAGFGVILVRLLWKLAPRLTLRWPAPLIEALASIVFASGYASIAGLGLPTRRALVMIGVLLAANLLRRARAPVQGLAFAVIALLALDPLCVLSAGFWLSFVGVAWLLFCLGGRRAGAPVPRRPWMAESGRRAGAPVRRAGARVPWRPWMAEKGPRRPWMAESGRDLVIAQGIATIGLLPLTIWFFAQSSLVGPVANLIAVPWICFVVLPVGVLGALLQLGAPTIGVPLVKLAGAALYALWFVLEKMAAWPAALWYFPEASAGAFALAIAGAIWLLLPRGVPARALGLLLFLPLLLPVRDELRDGEFEALLLDVGQGLSVVVRTREHALVYDTGARFPSGFDLGEASVVPSLHAIGVDRLDRLIVSHGDNDHSGGAAAVLAAFPAEVVESGEPGRLVLPAAQCLAGESWTWNAVTFRIVHPHEPLSSIANDRCCVLEVRSGDSALLLTGDITAAVEGDVAAALQPEVAMTILQVPHHGSRTSSGAPFITAVRPPLALVSAGYHNHFHHPSPAVVERYRAAGAEVLNSANEGFVRLRFAADAAPHVVERGRVDRHPYWREE